MTRQGEAIVLVFDPIPYEYHQTSESQVFNCDNEYHQTSESQVFDCDNEYRGTAFIL